MNRSRCAVIKTSSNFPCSRSREEDRDSTIKEDDSWHEQCWVIRVMRNNSKNVMSECLLHWNQGIVYCICRHLLTKSEVSQKFSPTATVSFLNRELLCREGAISRCSARQNWSTERAFCVPHCAEEMFQKEFGWNSRSFPTRRSAFVMDELVQAIVFSYHMRNMRDIERIVISHWRNHREFGEERFEPIPFSSVSKVVSVFFQDFMIAVKWTLEEFVFFCCSTIVYSCWQSVATDM